MRSVIHWSEVSRRFAKSSLVTMPGGSAVPHPVIAAPITSRPFPSSATCGRRRDRRPRRSLRDLDAEPRYGLSANDPLTGEDDHAHQRAGEGGADLHLACKAHEVANANADLELGLFWRVGLRATSRIAAAKPSSGWNLPVADETMKRSIMLKRCVLRPWRDVWPGEGLGQDFEVGRGRSPSRAENPSSSSDRAWRDRSARRPARARGTCDSRTRRASPGSAASGPERQSCAESRPGQSAGSV